MTQQTAVEWLASEINSRGPKENNPPQWLQELYDKSKQMEKEQLHKCGSFWRGKECEIEKKIFDDYYNETYTTRLQNETN
jgi:hypothetical protein